MKVCGINEKLFMIASCGSAYFRSMTPIASVRVTLKFISWESQASPNFALSDALEVSLLNNSSLFSKTLPHDVQHSSDIAEDCLMYLLSDHSEDIRLN
jgi:hypothetical protein